MKVENWISIKKALPEVYTDKSSDDVLVAGYSNIQEEVITSIGWIKKGKWGCLFEDKGHVMKITHWMPLPEPPND